MRIKSLKANFAVLLVLLVPCIPVYAQQIPSETWMGIYIGKTKIGYSSSRIDKSKFNGKAGYYRLSSSSVTRLLLFGDKVGQTTDSTIYLDSKFSPVYEAFKMSSFGHVTTVTAKFSEKEIVAEVKSGGEKAVEKIPIPPGSKLVGDSTYFSPTIKLNMGDKQDFQYFNPLTIRLEDMHVEVLRKEQIDLADGSYEALVLRALTPMGEMICWQDEKGDLLKATAVMGIVMIREPKDVAMSSKPAQESYSPPADLAVMTSTPTETKIPDPRKVEYLRIRISGLPDKSLVISDSRQKVTLSEGEKLVAEYEIRASEPDRAKTLSLPIADPETQKHLADAPYVQPSDPEIAAAAKSIVGNEKNACAVVSKLRAWVHDNMKPESSIGIVRSSVDVLHSKSGVCRDYAVLYTALARSAGVPTKVVAGLVYWKGGFYYHAWAESFVGEWVSVDATLPTDFVDATHIKLSEGDPTAMFDIVKAISVLKAEIVDFK